MFGGAILMGFTFGLMFGLLDVEDFDDETYNRLKMNIFYAFLVGLAYGIVMGALNEVVRIYYWVQTADQRPLVQPVNADL